jgi:hypothetical protein
MTLSAPNIHPHQFNNISKMPCTMNGEKTQPWRAHWPAPAKATEGVEYGVEKGQVVVVDGTSAKVSVAKDSTSAADKEAK